VHHHNKREPLKPPTTNHAPPNHTNAIKLNQAIDRSKDHNRWKKTNQDPFIFIGDIVSVVIKNYSEIRHRADSGIPFDSANFVNTRSDANLRSQLPTATASIDPALSLIMTITPSQSLILIVDPYSTGCMVAQEISKRGYPIMAIWVSFFRVAALVRCEWTAVLLLSMQLEMDSLLLDDSAVYEYSINLGERNIMLCTFERFINQATK
jgi:hypothetical protein